MNTIALLKSANEMKKNRLSSSDKRLFSLNPTPVSAAEMLAAAQRIKDKRIASAEQPKPIPPQKYAQYKKAFVCKDLFRIEVLVFPSDHAIERFAQRYNFVDHHFYPTSENEVLAKMLSVFKLCRWKTDIKHINRNQKHGKGHEIVAWGNDSVDFIVDTNSRVILTSELCGNLAKYN